jgi:hypothetical protein
MNIQFVTKKTLNTAKRGTLHASRSAKGWPIGSTLRLLTNSGDEVQADVQSIEPRGTAYTVHLINVRTIRNAKPEPEYKRNFRRGVRPYPK